MMSPPIKTLVMGLMNPTGNPRPNRLIKLCRSLGHEVHVASYSLSSPLFFDCHYEIAKPSPAFLQKILRKIIGLAGLIAPSSRLRDYLSELRWGFSRLQSQLDEHDFNLIFVEDLYLLPFAFKIKKNAKIVFDAREYYPEQSGHSLLWRMTERLYRMRVCREYLHLCDKIITVSPGLAEKYQAVFHVECDLIRSVPAYREIPVRETQEDRIGVVHHGVANKNRRLQNLIDIARYLDSRFYLDFYLTGDAANIQELKSYAANVPSVTFKEPVEFNDIIPMLNTYDIGLCYLEPSTFNLRHCLPNKFFECIQARLMVALGPSPDMASLANEYGFGLVSESFTSNQMAVALNSLTKADIDRAKRQSDLAAHELCFEKERIKLEAIIRGLTP